MSIIIIEIRNKTKHIDEENYQHLVNCFIWNKKNIWYCHRKSHLK